HGAGALAGGQRPVALAPPLVERQQTVVGWTGGPPLATGRRDAGNGVTAGGAVGCGIAGGLVARSAAGLALGCGREGRQLVEPVARSAAGLALGCGREGRQLVEPVA